MARRRSGASGRRFRRKVAYRLKKKAIKRWGRRYPRSRQSISCHAYKRTFLLSNQIFTMPGTTGQLLFAIKAQGFYNVVLATSGPTVNCQLPGYNDFTGLYDQYKILRYSLSFIPGNSEYYSGGGAVAPTIYWVQDSDDGAVPTSIDDIAQRPSIRAKKALHYPVTLVRKYPCVAYNVYRTGVNPAYGVKRSPWINMATADVEHYGMKGYISGTPLVQYVFDIRVTVWFMCKSPQ